METTLSADVELKRRGRTEAARDDETRDRFEEVTNRVCLVVDRDGARVWRCEASLLHMVVFWTRVSC